MCSFIGNSKYDALRRVFPSRNAPVSISGSVCSLEKYGFLEILACVPREEIILGAPRTLIVPSEF